VKVIVAGSRGIKNEDVVFSCIERSGFAISEVVSGGADGVDKIGEIFAQRAGLPCTQFIPNWRIGKKAGYLRNERMGKYGEAAVIVWDGESRGTKSMIGFMEKFKKPYKLFDHAGNESMFINGRMARNFEEFWRDI
jgi:hypothetical protein